LLSGGGGTNPAIPPGCTTPSIGPRTRHETKVSLGNLGSNTFAWTNFIQSRGEVPPFGFGTGILGQHCGKLACQVCGWKKKKKIKSSRSDSFVCHNQFRRGGSAWISGLIKTYRRANHLRRLPSQLQFCKREPLTVSSADYKPGSDIAGGKHRYFGLGTGNGPQSVPPFG